MQNDGDNKNICFQNTDNRKINTLLVDVFIITSAMAFGSILERMDKVLSPQGIGIAAAGLVSTLGMARVLEHLLNKNSRNSNGCDISR